MTQSFWVPGPLPCLNDIIAAAKSGRGKGNAYSRLKAKWTNDIVIHIKAARMRPVDRAHVRFIWHEAHRRRDPDGIAAASKFILDSLVVAKVLENDGWGQIVGFTHAWEVSSKPGVMVSLFSSPEG